MDKEQRNGVRAIGKVVDEMKGHGISKVRVYIQRDCRCELLITMETISLRRLKRGPIDAVQDTVRLGIATVD